MPRPKTTFPAQPALLAHDAEVVAAGITTVFDALGVGDPYGDGWRARPGATARRDRPARCAPGAAPTTWLHALQAARTECATAVRTSHRQSGGCA
ncbi:MAG: hypothetical protein R3E68_19960 [Burkholderiaceae bacterium]